MLFIALVILCQFLFILPARPALNQPPPMADLGRYVYSRDTYWIVYDRTVQQLRNEGYDVAGEANWLLRVNYTRLDYTFTCKITRLSWPNVTIQIVEGSYDLNVTAHRIMDDGSVGERLGSFLKVKMPPYPHSWDSWDPNLGVGFNPSVLSVGNTFSHGLLTYVVNRTEVLAGTRWSQNNTCVLYGNFANSSHSYRWTIWCDTYSGIYLKQVVWSETPMFRSYEEHNIIETGVQRDRFVVYQEGKIHEVQVATNSTLSGFSFDSAARKISLSVEGTSGTLGSCNLTIPKSMVFSGFGFEVQVDGKKTDYVLNEDADSYFIFVTYLHSTHLLTVSFVSSPIWLQWWFWLIIVAVAASAGAAYILLKRKRSAIPTPQKPSKT